MKFLATALLIGTAAAPAALAQTAPATPATPAPAAQTAPQGPAVGVTVKDTANGDVGMIEAINGDLAVINTGTNKVSYPLNAMTPTPTGPIIALTKAQLDASFAEQQAKAAAELQTRLAAGTEVFARDGSTKLGTIKAVDAEFVTLTTTAGKDVRLPKGGFATGRVGLVIGMTAPEFTAATAGA
ncbi:hypothetical protein [uncultured Sphingomonas sp.]|uniref:hypothetical protein n=1 Tax=uncultured Sphingomonas sp. TaxID=158754 RepID=UPI0025F04989|nr:hypothetical protein [uncultured Sphingomonas sp.]